MSLLDRPGPLQGRRGVTPAGRAPNLVKLDVELAQVEAQLQLMQIRLDCAHLDKRQRTLVGVVCEALTTRAENLRTWIAWEEELAT